MMVYAPINALTWTLGAAAMVTFAFKSGRSYRYTRNPLANIYFWVATTLAVAFCFLGMPPFFTQNTDVLKYTYFFADLFVQLSMQAMAWLLWFIGLRRFLRLRVLLLGTSIFSAGLMVAQLLTSQASISQSSHLVVYADHWPVLVMKSLIYIAIAWPLGYFFLREALMQATQRAKVKSFSTGLIFLLVSLAATINNIFDKGSDTVESTITVAVFFGIFLVISMLPPANTKA